MKTIILNGSPKGNIKKSGSYLLAQAFAKGMNVDCEIHAIIRNIPDILYAKIAEADKVIFIIPVYIHSIPGFVLDFLYKLPRCNGRRCDLGFILQSGFPESSESEIAERFLTRYVNKSDYGYLGTVIKGGCAGLAIMPDKFGKLMKSFEEFGTKFNQTGQFDPELMKKYAEPIYLTKFQCGFLNFMHPLTNYMGWGKILKQNNVYDKRLDMPFLKSRV